MVRGELMKKRGMKGFVQIIEIIVVSLMMFVIFSQFAVMPKINNDWSETKKYMKSRDMAAVLNSIDVDWSNSQEVVAILDRTFTLGGARNTTMVYDLVIDGMIKPTIKIGCIGKFGIPSDECNVFNSTLSSVYVNGKKLNFFMEPINPASPQFPSDKDVIVIMDDFFQPVFHAPHTLEEYSAQIKNYLIQEKGILVIRDFENYVASANITARTVFGIGWNSSLPDSNLFGFPQKHSHPNSTFYKFYRYFYNFPKSTGMKIVEPYTFPDLLSSYEHMVANNYTNAECILAGDSSGERKCGLILNNGAVNERGRTGWLSFPESGILDTPENRVLLKSLMEWLAGENYHVLNNNIGNPSISRFYKIMGPVGLVGFWEMDECLGSVSYDSSLNRNSGKENGSVGCRNGIVRNAAVLDSSYIEVNDSLSLQAVSTSFTIEGWFNSTNLTTPGINRYPLVSKGDNKVYISKSLQICSEWSFTDGSYCYLNSTSMVNENSWHFYAFVFNGSRISLYIDGGASPDAFVDCGSGKFVMFAGQPFRIGGM